jgi:hypothetical protein
LATTNYQKGLVIRNADIQGAKIGIEAPHFVVGTLWNIYGGGRAPRSIVINNVYFDAAPGMGLSSVSMSFSGDNGRNMIQRDEVYVYNYNYNYNGGGGR